MAYPYGIDVGTCASDYGDLKLLDCFNNTDGKNYCCTRATNLLIEPTYRACCTYEEYADQHWLGLALIKCLLVLISFVFVCTICVLTFFFISSYDVSEKDIKASRRVIIKELMKKQLLSKSSRIDPSAVASLISLSNSVKRSREKQSKEKNKAIEDTTKPDSIWPPPPQPPPPPISGSIKSKSPPRPNAHQKDQIDNHPVSSRQ